MYMGVQYNNDTFVVLIVTIISLVLLKPLLYWHKINGFAENCFIYRNVTSDGVYQYFKDIIGLMEDDG